MGVINKKQNYKKIISWLFLKFIVKRVEKKSVFKDISGVFQKYNKYALTLRENIEISDFYALGNTEGS